MPKQTEQLPELEAGMAELTINLPGQEAPFRIYGDYEDLAPYAEALQEADKQIPAQRTPRALKVAHAAVESLTAPIQTGLGRGAMDFKTVMYDKVHRTNFYEMLQDKRNTERDLRFAG